MNIKETAAGTNKMTRVVDELKKQVVAAPVKCYADMTDEEKAIVVASINSKDYGRASVRARHGYLKGKNVPAFEGE